MTNITTKKLMIHLKDLLVFNRQNPLMASIQYIESYTQIK